MFSVEVSKRAIQDMEKARDWYEEMEKDLGQRFIDAVENCIIILSKTPYFAIRYKKIRCIPLADFPYMIHYQVFSRKKRIIIAAVFHTSRKPLG